jgi:hypothetical protein
VVAPNDRSLWSFRETRPVRKGDLVGKTREQLRSLHFRVRRSDFEALLERGRTVARPAPGLSPAQAFWEGDFHPMPTVDPAEDE